MMRAQAHYDDARFDSARILWEGALERARAADDAAEEARLLTSLGLVAWRTGDYDRAADLQSQALAIERANDLADLFPRTYNALGLLAWDRGRFGEAAELLERTAEAAREVGDDGYLSKAMVNLGLVQTAVGDIAAARRAFLDGVAAFHAMADPAMEARTLVNLASLEIRSGDAQAALELLTRARDLSREAGDRAGEEAALGQLGTALAALGRYQASLAVLDSALRLARDHGLRQPESANLEAIAGIHRELGDLPRALEYYDRALAINAELGLADETGATLRNKAEIQAELGHLDVATATAAEALARHRGIESRFGELADLLVLAEVAERSGNAAAADRHLAEARAVARALGVRSARVDVALGAARVADRREAASLVLAVLDGVAPDLEEVGYWAEWEAEALRARALERRGDLKAAAAAGRRAVALLERVRGDLGSGALRSTLGHSRAGTYAHLVDVLIQLGRMEEALEVSDRARERPLPGGAGALKPPSESLLHRIAALAASIREYEEITEDPAAVTELVDRLRAARSEYEALLARAPRMGEPGPGGKAVSIDSLLAALRTGEGLLHYLVGEDRVVAFLVTSEGVRAVRLPVRPSALQTRVRVARRLLAEPGGASPEGVLARLHEELISPVAEGGALAGVDRLIIVPHGVLTYLPFAALKAGATGRLLVQDRILVYLPSAAYLRRNVLPEHPGGPGSDAAPSVFAPVPTALPASRAEAAAVAETLGPRARVLVGPEASEPAVRQALTRNGIVHIASHASLDPSHPFFSRIELAPPPGAPPYPPEADGGLEVHELDRLSIRSPLVFLSGCETGLGAGWTTEFAAGEDYATLDRALLRAGAGNVVATLWRVRDESAAAFAARFYERLATGDAAEAIAGAQRDLMRDPRYAHPFHWAGYRLAGRGAEVGKER